MACRSAGRSCATNFALWRHGFIAMRKYHARSGVYGHLPIGIERAEELQPVTSSSNAALLHLINAYRRFGFAKAKLDPLGLAETNRVCELEPKIYGLDSTETVRLNGSDSTVSDLVKHLEAVYCGPMAMEFMYLRDWSERQWLGKRFEQLHATPLTREERIQLAKLMLRCQNFDRFLATKFSTVKRYGGEGAESMMAFFEQIIQSSFQHNIQEVILCMAHRGRLNLLTDLLQYPAVQMFRKFRGKLEFPDDIQGAGDVPSHLTNSFDITKDGAKLHITMLPNPSHLEAVNPVAVGKTRARAQSLKLGDYGRIGDGVLCVQVHGDGAFTGQGIVWETLALSQVPHFRVGGSVHLITNNQVGFTAEAHIGRSTSHASDLAKAIDCPVLHVNGDHPEELAKATVLAMEYRDRFRKDIFINLICYRRWGHNELDDPTFTQPIMYRCIESRRSVPDAYAERLCSEGMVKKEELDAEIDKHSQGLMEQFRNIDQTPPSIDHLKGLWMGMSQAPKAVEVWDTGFDVDQLKGISIQSVTVKDKFVQKTHCAARKKKIEGGEPLDWATAEAMAFGSILLQGMNIRLSGQDVGRGTFSHRHAMLVDQETDEVFVPLNHFSDKQSAFLEVANNLLSEEAILGFEYGMSIENPKRLTVWEAQFGDFFNGAQIIIDTFISSGESKWLRQSGLVMLLPHGFDGAGPEHSSCRMERFLQLSDSSEGQKPPDGVNINIQVVNPTTSSQYFHLLRRQPLIVVAPKILLRHPQAASSLHEFATGSHFRTVLDDEEVKNPTGVAKVILVSGKHAYTLMKERKQRQLNDVAIIRLEALSPFPLDELRMVLNRYPKANKWIWSQEEPRNAGAWSFVRGRCANGLGIQLQYAGRPELAWTASAVAEMHNAELERLLKDTWAM